MFIRRTSILLILLAAALVLPACSGGGYALSGRVVEGDLSMLSFVEADDPLLDGRGVGGVKIVIYRDGDKPWPKRVTEGRSRADGEVTIPINEFGAGWMIEQWLVEAHKPGYQSCEAILTFPSSGSGRELLITLTPGESRPLRLRDELMEQYEQYR